MSEISKFLQLLKAGGNVDEQARQILAVYRSKEADASKVKLTTLIHAGTGFERSARFRPRVQGKRRRTGTLR